MKTVFDRKFWVICFIWTSFNIAGTLTVNTATTEQIPRKILEKIRNADPSEIRHILNNTRRILIGKEATNNRPYMVYLKLPSMNIKYQDYKNWLCGGVIVHPEYIITSAACIEDVRHFYVVSGTFKFSFLDDRFNNPCIKNGAKKAIWKCIPKNYVFDGHENDNIRWMNNDIAVVKLEEEIDFTRRVRGCDFIPKPVCYNNQSVTLEEAGNVATIAGWGSTERYNDWVNSRRRHSRRIPSDDQTTCLLESPVTILGKTLCKKRWGSRYHNIIDNYMICTKDLTSELSEICMEKYVDCQDLVGESSEETASRRSDPNTMVLHSARHEPELMRRMTPLDGGFCENDHGGPLVYGEGVNSVVIGIISACLVKERTNKCYGPFLYTSVYKNRVLINCAIYNNVGADCSKLFRARKGQVEVEMSWDDHPDGPAKSEKKVSRRKAEEEEKNKLLSNRSTYSSNITESTTVVRSNATALDYRTTDSENDSPKSTVEVAVRTRDKDDEFQEIIKNNEHAAPSESKTTEHTNSTI